MKTMYILIAFLFGGIIGLVIAALCAASGKADLVEKYEDKLSELQSELATKTALCDALDKTNIEYFNRIVEIEYQLKESTAQEAATKKERLPVAQTNFFAFMDYRKITDMESDQYRLQQECFTEESTGIRTYNCDGITYYCVALGSAYGRDIGDTWCVTLVNGLKFNIILAEFKDDGSTEFFGHYCKNYDDEDCINVIEFIVDTQQVPAVARARGTMSALGYFGGLFGDDGNIVEMKYTERWWY